MPLRHNARDFQCGDQIRSYRRKGIALTRGVASEDGWCCGTLLTHPNGMDGLKEMWLRQRLCSTDCDSQMLARAAKGASVSGEKSNC